MSGFYPEEELIQLGLNKIGKSVFVSRKASIYGAENITLGDSVRIDDFCILSGNIHIGNYVHIAAYTALYGGKEGIYISDFANLSSRVTVYSISDDYSGKSMTNPLIPDSYKSLISKKVLIEKHVIVGSTSVILPGVTLAEGGAFGSFSFINRNTEPWSIYAGIPVKKIQERDKNIIDLEKQFYEDINGQ